MSHSEVVKSVVKNIDTARKTFEEMGGVVEEADTYHWWGTDNGHSVGDHPMPEGYTEADLGKCQYRVHFPGIQYEVGLVRSKTGQGYDVLYDFWDRALKEKLGGARAEKFVQLYSLNEAEIQCRQRGFTTRRVKVDGGMQLQVWGM